ncbi:MAG TPA: hypothetical protein VMX54_12110 [Vicinamibacteria bacterium]|nr:hypothetical protein [Vicinamibacteria bacterium]
MSSRGSSEPLPGLLRLLLALALVSGWTALLAMPVRQPRGAAEALLCAPLGLLAVFAFRDRSLRLTRAVLVGLPAFALALAAAGVAVWLHDRAAGPPGPSDLLLPALGALGGVLLGLALRRGLGALLMLPVKLAAAAVLLLVVGLGLLVSSLQREPALSRAPEVSPADRRRLVAVFRGKDPRDIPEGEVRTLRLEQQDLDRLLAWRLPLVQDPEGTRAAVALEGDDAVTVRLSVRVPRVGRWVNLSAAARVGVDAGRFFLRQPRLSVGRLTAPPRLMDALAPALAAAVRAERRLRPVLAAVRELRVERDALVATYGRAQLPGSIAGQFWGESGSAGLPGTGERE